MTILASNINLQDTATNFTNSLLQINNSSNTGSLAVRPDTNIIIPKNELQDINKYVALSDKFTITFSLNGKDTVINFYLLPAVETVLNYSSPTSKFRGGPSVPELRPGIPIRTVMRIKNHIVPGSYNITQNLGLDNKSIVLVGAIIPPVNSAHTYITAKYIDENIVQRGALIAVSIIVSKGSSKDPNNQESISFTGSIIEFKYYTVRSNLTYYSFNIVYSSYSLAKRITYKQLNVERPEATIINNSFTVGTSGSGSTSSSSIGSNTNANASLPPPSFGSGAAVAFNPNGSQVPGSNFNSYYLKAVNYIKQTNINKNSSKTDIDNKLTQAPTSEFKLAPPFNILSAQRPTLESTSTTITINGTAYKPFINIMYISDNGSPKAEFYGPSAEPNSFYKQEIPLLDALPSSIPKTTVTDLVPSVLELHNLVAKAVQSFINQYNKQIYPDSTYKELQNFITNTVKRESYIFGKIKLAKITGNSSVGFSSVDDDAEGTSTISLDFEPQQRDDKGRYTKIENISKSYFLFYGSSKENWSSNNSKIGNLTLNASFITKNLPQDLPPNSVDQSKPKTFNYERPASKQRDNGTLTSKDVQVIQILTKVENKAKELISKLKLYSGQKLSDIKVLIQNNKDPFVSSLVQSQHPRSQNDGRHNFSNINFQAPTIEPSNILKPFQNTLYKNSYRFEYKDPSIIDPSLTADKQIISWITFLPKVEQKDYNAIDSQSYSHVAIYVYFFDIQSVSEVSLLPPPVITPSLPLNSNLQPVITRSDVKKVFDEVGIKANQLMLASNIKIGMNLEQALTNLKTKSSSLGFNSISSLGNITTLYYKDYNQTINNSQPFDFINAGISIITYKQGQNLTSVQPDIIQYFASLQKYEGTFRTSQSTYRFSLNYPYQANVQLSKIVDQIISTGKTTEAQLKQFILKKNSSALSNFPDIASLYIQEARTEGVNHDIAFCQMCLETTFLSYKGNNSNFINNFANISTPSGGSDLASFTSPRIGVRAHIQHLHAYATSKPLTLPIVDPRFNFVTKGIAPTLDQLSGKWSPDLSYGKTLMAIINDLYKSLNII